MIKSICPYCDDMMNLSIIRKQENILVRGEDIPIDSCFLLCEQCNNSFDDPKSDFDALALAYKGYRTKHNMLQPDDIKRWRARLGLTQIELANILGFGDVTIQRYESGKLQETSHDKAMRLAMKPNNLLSLINENDSCIVDNEKRKAIIQKLQAEIELENSFESFFNIKFNTYPANIYSGYRKLDLYKVFSALIFFCDGLYVFKTKLNKLMFYADFKFFKEYDSSITGLQYAKLPYGPVPNNYDYYIATLVSEQKVIMKEENGGEKFLSCQKPDLSIFSDDEIEILMKVKRHFKDMTATKISDYSHKEKAYTETEDSKIISYKFASEITL